MKNRAELAIILGTNKEKLDLLPKMNKDQLSQMAEILISRSIEEKDSSKVSISDLWTSFNYEKVSSEVLIKLWRDFILNKAATFPRGINSKNFLVKRKIVPALDKAVIKDKELKNKILEIYLESLVFWFNKLRTEDKKNYLLEDWKNFFDNNPEHLPEVIDKIDLSIIKNRKDYELLMSLVRSSLVDGLDEDKRDYLTMINNHFEYYRTSLVNK